MTFSSINTTLNLLLLILENVLYAKSVGIMYFSAFVFTSSNEMPPSKSSATNWISLNVSFDRFSLNIAGHQV